MTTTLKQMKENKVTYKLRLKECDGALAKVEAFKAIIVELNDISK
eukprot:CAMPEP_0170490188 /NCGR_PEP_ID=MMETSP0208-20121228/8437_1 /TAXON_ID=197538 /ORGANISM="Strombidium inclinatum, Strain S3" /LENGTH=44 /DNA_ID= /DNA_START= /DNA_END= /DNA_ORIENTATION=